MNQRLIFAFQIILSGIPHAENGNGHATGIPGRPARRSDHRVANPPDAAVTGIRLAQPTQPHPPQPVGETTTGRKTGAAQRVASPHSGTRERLRRQLSKDRY